MITDFGLAQRSSDDDGSSLLPVPERRGGDLGHPRLHGAGAGRGWPGDAGHGRLCARGRPLRDGHRGPAVRGGHPAPDRGQAAAGAAPEPADPRARPGPSLGGDDTAMSGPPACRSLRQRRGRRGRARKGGPRAAARGRKGQALALLAAVVAAAVGAAFVARRAFRDEARRASRPSPSCPSRTPARIRRRNTSRTASARASSGASRSCPA